MSEQERIYPKGIWFNEPRKGAPDFIVANISIKAEDLIKFLETQKGKEYINKGYLKIDVLKKKKEDEYGKYNLQVNTWIPEDTKYKKEEKEEEINVEDIPF